MFLHLKTLFSAFLFNSYKPNYDLDYVLQQFTALLLRLSNSMAAQMQKISCKWRKWSLSSAILDPPLMCCEFETEAVKRLPLQSPQKGKIRPEQFPKLNKSSVTCGCRNIFPALPVTHFKKTIFSCLRVEWCCAGDAGWTQAERALTDQQGCFWLLI